MKFSKLNSPNSFANVVISKYFIDWNRKVSAPQLKVKNFLKEYWESSIVLEEFLIPGSKKRIDLINISAKVVVEVSPNSTHLKFNSFMHGSRPGFLKTIKSDLVKKDWAEANNFLYIELNDSHLKNLSKETFKELGYEL